MGKIATDANPLAESIETGAISTSRLVVEAEMGVDEVANGLNTRPSSLQRAVPARSTSPILKDDRNASIRVWEKGMRLN
jgi:hypothetical protein